MEDGIFGAWLGVVAVVASMVIFTLGVIAGSQGDVIMRDCEITGVYIVNSENAIKCEVME